MIPERRRRSRMVGSLMSTYAAPRRTDRSRHRAYSSGAAADRVLDRRLAPGGDVPLRLEPSAHRRLGLLAGAADVDRELVGACERLRVAPGLAGEAHDLLPRLPVALGRVEVGEPAVAHPGDAPEDGVHVAADEDGRAGLLYGTGPHDGLAQIELVHAESHAVLGPQAGQDLEVPL